jgi:hypothetical protein
LCSLSEKKVTSKSGHSSNAHLNNQSGADSPLVRRKAVSLDNARLLPLSEFVLTEYEQASVLSLPGAAYRMRLSRRARGEPMVSSSSQEPHNRKRTRRGARPNHSDAVEARVRGSRDIQSYTNRYLCQRPARFHPRSQ